MCEENEEKFFLFNFTFRLRSQFETGDEGPENLLDELPVELTLYL